MKTISIIAYLLAIVGSIVWLLVGLFAFNPIAWIFGGMTVLPRIIYTLVGLAGLWLIFFWIAKHPFENV